MRLYIAEKPSLGRAIADVLPKPHQRGEGFIKVANGDCVSWCVGHLLELEEPKAYDPAFEKWKLDDLPILPDQWRLKPKNSSRKQLSVLRKLIKEADEIIHAGDPDREGQLLVDQVINYLRVPKARLDKVQRCLINDLNPDAVSRALTALRPNKEFVPLSVSALARTRADWLYGINMTRAYTLQGRKVGYNGLLSVGRVQTPLLGMVVRRDEEIENFQSKAFYEVLAQVEMKQGEGVRFKAKWQPSESCLPFMDEEGRVLSKALGLNVVGRIQGKPAQVTQVEKKTKKLAPPLPYNLSSLQIDAAKSFGYKAQQVLDSCQKLYERDKLITYPRSDCRYLPKKHFQQRHEIVESIQNNGGIKREWLETIELSRQSKAWNDDKIEAHHAIIPTAKKTDINKLSTQDRNIYQLIARQYLAQFCEPYQFQESLISLNIEGGVFNARAKKDLELGWKSLFKKDRQQSVGREGDDLVVGELPKVSKGDLLHCKQGELLEKQTQPPKFFTDATLLSAMTGISRFVKDEKIRKILRETDGLGTEATRAGIIELLFQRNFLYREGKSIRATEAGRALIRGLPDIATTPDMTAQWESKLLDISENKMNYDLFMGPMVKSLVELIADCKNTVPEHLKGLSDSVVPFRRGKKIWKSKSSHRRKGKRTSQNVAK